MNTFVVSGLIKRRAQLAGDIEKAHFAVIGSGVLRIMLQCMSPLVADIVAKVFLHC